MICSSTCLLHLTVWSSFKGQPLSHSGSIRGDLYDDKHCCPQKPLNSAGRFVYPSGALRRIDSLAGTVGATNAKRATVALRGSIISRILVRPFSTLGRSEPG
jgi:hypothetical protein